MLAAPWAVLAARTRLFPPVPQLRLRAEPMCSVRVVQWLLTLVIKTAFSVVHSWAFFFSPSPPLFPHLEPGLGPSVVPLGLFAELCQCCITMMGSFGQGKGSRNCRSVEGLDPENGTSSQDMVSPVPRRGG